jgi:hypothetical protein
MTHAHLTTWILAIILFFVALSMQKSGKEQPLKIIQMILRLFYVLIIITGGLLLAQIDTISGSYIFKTIMGLVTVGMLEMILVRGKKGKSTGMFWAILVIAFLITLYMGLKLPIGFHPFL